MQFGPYLRKVDRGYSFWCPACKRMHVAYDNWTFNGNPDRPTFSPSLKIEGVRTVRDAQGRWTGDWEYDAQGKPIRYVCHFHIVDGQMQFCPDCTHDLAGKTVPLPELPDFLKDWSDDDPNLL